MKEPWTSRWRKHLLDSSKVQRSFQLSCEWDLGASSLCVWKELKVLASKHIKDQHSWLPGDFTDLGESKLIFVGMEAYGMHRGVTGTLSWLSLRLRYLEGVWDVKPNERAPVVGLGLLFCLTMFEHGWDGTSLQRQFAFHWVCESLANWHGVLCTSCR